MKESSKINTEIWFERKRRLRKISMDESLPWPKRIQAYKIGSAYTDMIMWYCYGACLDNSVMKIKLT